MVVRSRIHNAISKAEMQAAFKVNKGQQDRLSSINSLMQAKTIIFVHPKSEFISVNTLTPKQQVQYVII
jgi:hypothetical protein